MDVCTSIRPLAANSLHSDRFSIRWTTESVALCLLLPPFSESIVEKIPFEEVF